MRKISLEEIIAFDSTSGGKELLSKYGMKPARNHKELANKLKHLTKANGEDFLEKLADIHPDKDLILHYFGNESKSNADGVSNCACGRTSSAPNLSGIIPRLGSSQELFDDYWNFNGGGSEKKEISESNTSKPSSEYAPLYGMGLIMLGFVGVIALATRK